VLKSPLAGRIYRLWHEELRRESTYLCSKRNAQSVVSRRASNDAGRCCLAPLREGAHGIERPAHLKGSRNLLQLKLEPRTAISALKQQRALNTGFAHKRLEASLCLPDHVVSNEDVGLRGCCGHAVFLLAAKFLTAPHALTDGSPHSITVQAWGSYIWHLLFPHNDSRV
jgi:hypothetical protein